MISFRYHIVSLVAVFLALALGIVVGTTALNGPITKDLRKQVNSVKSQRDKLAGRNKTLQTRLDNAGKFASTYGAQVVSQALAKRPVLVVSLPGATSAMRDGVTRQITNAGATITGQVALTDDYVKPSLGGGIASLATTDSARPTSWNAPETNDAGQLGGSLLAWVLLGRAQPGDLAKVLGAFSELHMVSAASSVTAASDVVVVGRGTHPKNDYGARAELAFLGWLAKDRGHVVLAGDASSARGGGLVALVRDAAGVRNSVATIDNADSAFGQVSTALALADAVKGQTGQYGTQDGADALFPSPPD